MVRRIVVEAFVNENKFFYYKNYFQLNKNIMRYPFFFAYILAFMIVSLGSCTDNITTETPDKTTNLNVLNGVNNGSNDYITANVFSSGESCGSEINSSSTFYKMAASSGTSVNYDRYVSVGITKNQSIIETGTVFIPANQTANDPEDAVDVFTNPIPTQTIGSVDVKVFSVFKNSRFGENITDEWELIDQSVFVNNCKREEPCTAGDQDNDGICDSRDDDVGGGFQ